jgi:hypothetical protein
MALGWLSVAYHPHTFPENWSTVSRVEIRDAYTHRHGTKILLEKVLYRTWYLMMWVFDPQTVW